MAPTSRPDNDEQPRVEHPAPEPRGAEVEDLPVADEESSEQVLGGRKRLGQDMDPY